MICIDDSTEAELAKLAAERGWPLEVLRGVVLGQMQGRMFRGADHSYAQQQTIRHLKHTARHIFDPHPPCVVCGATDGSLIPPVNAHEEVLCDACAGY